MKANKMLIGVMLAGMSAVALAGTPPLEKDREKVVAFFAENVYGVRPDLSAFKPTCAVKDLGVDARFGAIRREVALNVMTPLGERTFTTTMFVPTNAVPRRVPCFVYMSFQDPVRMLAEPKNAKIKPWRWPVKDILARGYATAAFHYTAVFPDDRDKVVAWGRSERPANGWGAISAWALAAGRVADYLGTDAAVDAKRIALVGHSRLGKTTLWAGATDTRFALLAINDSGCLGACAKTRSLAGAESIDAITRAFPHWFAPNCRAKFAGKDADLPFDQHWLIAALAPRLVCVGSAEDDAWACPSGEHAALDLARPAWGREAKTRCHYHIRPGEHDINGIDWADYLDFAAKSGW